MSCIHHDLYHAHMTLYLLIILIGCEVVRSHDTQSMGWMINQQQSLSHILHIHALVMQLRLTFR